MLESGFSKNSDQLSHDSVNGTRAVYAERIIRRANNEKAIRTAELYLGIYWPKTDRLAKLKMKDLVFINFRTGEPAKNSSFDTQLYKLCDEAGLQHFNMHALRHAFATRCVEYNVQPKYLQQLLGHSSIKTTMDRYVHVTTDSLKNAIKTFEACTAKQIKMAQKPNPTIKKPHK